MTAFPVRLKHGLGDGMSKVSAGLLMYRLRQGVVEVLLAHPGGPFWRNEDDGAWTIPKGEIAPGEDAHAAALREFEEETGIRPEGPFPKASRATRLKWSGRLDQERCSNSRRSTERRSWVSNRQSRRSTRRRWP